MIALIGVLPAIIFSTKYLLNNHIPTITDIVHSVSASAVFALLFIAGVGLCVFLAEFKKIILLIPLLCMAVFPVISGSEQDRMPKGAVVAFNSVNGCPVGWQLFTPALGRMIVGATQDAQVDNDKTSLTQRQLLDTGGAEKHRLSVAEMPSHNHTNGHYRYLLKSRGFNTYHGKDDKTSGEPNLKCIASIKASGGGQAHNNMPPFIALYYCQKQ